MWLIVALYKFISMIWMYIFKWNTRFSNWNLYLIFHYHRWIDFWLISRNNSWVIFEYWSLIRLSFSILIRYILIKRCCCVWFVYVTNSVSDKLIFFYISSQAKIRLFLFIFVGNYMFINENCGEYTSRYGVCEQNVICKPGM